MPQYIYRHPVTEELREIIQTMKEKHVFFTEENGEVIEWKRVYTIPKMSIDTKIDPFSSKDFVKNTNKKGTYGDVLDYSAELSEKRAEKSGGEDPIKRDYFNKYEKEVGKKHIHDKPKTIKTDQAIVEL